ncbi:hypothetical protein [Desulfolucanica intricata]|uniref:hypothetical protein n=1 Tax=Desulfolucanica intricata TaxID=1285191 RepID=UPI000836309E|nr:hypothetical protein [Desulfolucanica intricata]
MNKKSRRNRSEEENQEQDPPDQTEEMLLRRSRTKTASKAGRYVRSTMQCGNDDLAFDATMRAAVPYQVYRRRDEVAIAIEFIDIREKVREKRSGILYFSWLMPAASWEHYKHYKMDELKADTLVQAVK